MEIFFPLFRAWNIVILRQLYSPGRTHEKADESVRNSPHQKAKEKTESEQVRLKEEFRENNK